MCLPDGSWMLNSGDSRGIGADDIASVETNIRRMRSEGVNFCVLAKLPPLIDDALHLASAGSRSIFRALLVFKDTGHHLGNYRAVEYLHVSRGGKTGNAEIGSPVQGILELHVFVRRIGLRI